MPVVDNDIVEVIRATRTGSTNIDILITWRDGNTNESKGTFGVSWATAQEFREFLEQQDFNDLVRSLLLQCLDRDDGSLRPAVFDALPGKTFRVQSKVNQV